MIQKSMLAREGSSIAVAARRPDKLNKLVNEIVSNGGRAVALPTDVTAPAQVEQLVESVHTIVIPHRYADQ